MSPHPQVRHLRASVEESIAIVNSTTLLQRLKSLITVPIHRRALGKLPPNASTIDILTFRLQLSVAASRVINNCVGSIP